MPTMLTGQELRIAVEEQTFIEGGDASCAEGVKYDLRLSPNILKASFSIPVNADTLNETEKRQLTVDSGEVVFVLTEERLRLPSNITAQLSPKRKLSHQGILTPGGFCIDPGYHGRLLIGLLNFSSTPFQLRPGKKLIAATFFRLEGSEVGEFPPVAPSTDEFPDELVQVMQKYRPMAVQSVAATVQTIQTELQSLRSEIRSHEDWYQRFKDSLDTHNNQIGSLSRDLETEREVRKSGQDTLSTAVSGIERSLTFLRGAAWVVMVILGTGTTLFLAWLASVLFTD